MGSSTTETPASKVIAFLSKFPLRKPVAIGTFFLVAFCCIWGVCKSTDIPLHVSDTLQLMILVGIGGYVATSTVEAGINSKFLKTATSQADGELQPANLIPGDTESQVSNKAEPV